MRTRGSMNSRRLSIVVLSDLAVAISPSVSGKRWLKVKRENEGSLPEPEIQHNAPVSRLKGLDVLGPDKGEGDGRQLNKLIQTDELTKGV